MPTFLGVVRKKRTWTLLQRNMVHAVQLWCHLKTVFPYFSLFSRQGAPNFGMNPGIDKAFDSQDFAIGF